MSETTIPMFDLQESAESNFKKYNDFMKNVKKFEDVKRCRWTFEGYLKSCNVHEREIKRRMKEEDVSSIKFEVGT